jgi:pyruvate formate lyase activating enzyme
VADESIGIAFGDIIPFTTVDWPGRLSAVAFCVGCPWRCPYCQNHLLWDASSATSGMQDLVDLLEQRRGLLDGVVFSGGEPLAQASLPEAIAQVRDMGFEVALHTGGAYPEMLARILPDLSWVGFDVKAPWDGYEATTGVSGSGEAALASLREVIASGVDMEARTTWHPALLSADDISRIAHALADEGVASWAVQAYRHVGTTDELPRETVYPSSVPDDLPGLFEHYEFRRA